MTDSLPGISAQWAAVAGMEQRVRILFQRLSLDTRPTIVLGFSGGPDSLALASILAGMERSEIVRCVAVHVDHGLRADSGAEQQQVARLAEHVGLDFRATTLDVGLTARHPGVGIEEAARRERYLRLAEVVRQEGAEIVAVAHQQEDQAETVLLHLLRGAGLSGAAGMAELSSLVVPWWAGESEPMTQLRVWRPLLGESRVTLCRYLDAQGLSPIHDPSNNDLTLRRNAVRHRVVPLLEQISPGAIAALSRFGRIAAEDDEALETRASEALVRLAASDGSLPLATLAQLPIAIQRRLLRKWLVGGAQELSLERIDSIRSLSSSQGGRKVELPGGLVIKLEKGRLHLIRPNSAHGETA